MRLGFRHLQVLVTVADEGSISRAARVLRIRQPALSAQLHRIEAALEVFLFERRRDGVVPTELGRYAVARARELLGGLDELRTSLRVLAAAESPSLPVRVGGVAGPFVRGAVDVLHELQPGRDVTTVMEPMVGRLLDLLAAGELDFVLIHEWPGFEVRARPQVELRTLIGAEPIFLMVPESHPAAGRPEIELADLAGDDWVMMAADDTGLGARLRILCEASGFTPRFRHTATDSSDAVAMVAAGDAVSGVYPTGRQLPGVAIRPTAGGLHRRRVMLGWQSGSPVADIADQLVPRLVERYFALAAERPHYADWLARNGRDTVLSPSGDQPGKSLATV